MRSISLWLAFIFAIVLVEWASAQVNININMDDINIGVDDDDDDDKSPSSSPSSSSPSSSSPSSSSPSSSSPSSSSPSSPPSKIMLFGKYGLFGDFGPFSNNPSLLSQLSPEVREKLPRWLKHLLAKIRQNDIAKLKEIIKEVISGKINKPQELQDKLDKEVKDIMDALRELKYEILDTIYDVLSPHSDPVKKAALDLWQLLKKLLLMLIRGLQQQSQEIKNKEKELIKNILQTLSN